MDAYIYNAALICSDCAVLVIRDIERRNRTEGIPAGFIREDSDSFPQGPYPNGGGESDSAQHCDMCHLFLQNPLTTDGIEYVRGIVNANPYGWASAQWAEFYWQELNLNAS